MVTPYLAPLWIFPEWLPAVRSVRGVSGSSGTASAVEVAGGGVMTSGSGFALLLPPVLLHVMIRTPGSGGSGTVILADHVFLAPGASGDWERWLLDRILDVERHEAMEFFSISGRRPFYPEHGPQARLYDIVRH